MFWQVWPVGANFTWPKPFAALATIVPDWPVVVSDTTVSRPCAVSCIVTVKWSPWLRKNVFCGSAVKVAVVALIGLGGPSGRPSLVRNAKLTYSGLPMRSRQLPLSC